MQDTEGKDREAQNSGYVINYINSPQECINKMKRAIKLSATTSYIFFKGYFGKYQLYLLGGRALSIKLHFNTTIKNTLVFR